ncbi:MAG: hypothetical protein JO108_14440 [Acidobacteriaceae bacterium]|nr:hypothetical protein [Acidobacteriaceae bacterium]
MVRAIGVFVWMGRCANKWENDPGILGLAWRARTELVARETALQAMPPGPEYERECELLERVWKLQLLAESSDSLGWSPTPEEVKFAAGAAEEAFRQLAASERRVEAAGALEADLPNPDAGRSQKTPAEPFVPVGIVGAEGAISCIQTSRNLQECEAWFVATDKVHGIQFPHMPDRLTYCPSGLETDPVTIEPERFAPAVLYLPLANGLLSVGEDVYFIRENRFGVVAASISKRPKSSIRLVAENAPRKAYRWRFLLFRGSLSDAVELANTVNAV